MFMFKYFIICFFSLSAFAEVKVKSFVSPEEVAVNSVFTLTVEVSYSSGQEVRRPRLPKLDAFYLINESSSSSMQFSISSSQGGGFISARQKSYHYQLKPKKKGKFQIGSVKVVVDGKSYKSAPVEILVSSKSKKPVSPFSGDPKSVLRRFLHRGFSFDHFPEGDVKAEDIDVKLETGKSTAYIGERVLAQWFFYTPMEAGSPVNIRITEDPVMDGFWVESVTPPRGFPRAIKDKEAALNRKNKYLIMSSALFPVRAGPLEIGSVRVRSQFHLGAFLRSHPNGFLKRSNTKTIKVLPLPKEGRGDFFTEAVGDFSVSAEIENTDKKERSIQEPVVYKVKFKGEGHPRLIRLPSLDFGNSFEIYDTLESEQFSLSKSTKEFQIILIPKLSGNLSIPSFEISTFDPDIGVYKTHILPAFKVPVKGEVKNNKEEVSEKYFKSSAGGSESVAPGSSLSSWKAEKEIFTRYRKKFWFFVYAALLLCFIFLLKKRFFFNNNKQDFLKKEMKQILLRVDKTIKKRQWKEAGIELNQLLYSFCSELMREDKKAKNWDHLIQNINPSIRLKYESRIRLLISLLEKLSFSAYNDAKELRNKKSVERIKKEVLSIIRKITEEYPV